MRLIATVILAVFTVILVCGVFSISSYAASPSPSASPTQRVSPPPRVQDADTDSAETEEGSSTFAVILISLGIGGGVVGGLFLYGNRSNMMNAAARTYLSKDTLNVKYSSDNFVRTSVTRVKVKTDKK